jgi:hypothetical protein
LLAVGRGEHLRVRPLELEPDHPRVQELRIVVDE